MREDRPSSNCKSGRNNAAQNAAGVQDVGTSMDPVWNPNVSKSMSAAEYLRGGNSDNILNSSFEAQRPDWTIIMRKI